MTVHGVEQRSAEWIALRLGRLTASRASDMLAKTKTGWSTSRRNLMMQLVLERVTGKSQERNFINQAMQDGIDREHMAVAHYEAVTGVLIEPVGFCSHDTLMAGCSPDAFVGDDGLLSVKCPIPATHWEFLKTGAIPKDYLDQITCEFWITGRQWCDYLSFNPEFPENLQARIVRVTRVEQSVLEFDAAVRVFLAEVETEYHAVKTLSTPMAVA